MNKIHRTYVVLIVLLEMFPGGYAFGIGQTFIDSLSGLKQKQFTIQIAASRVFINPEFFKERFKLGEEISFIQKDGWYKYIIGRYKSESEAANRQALLKIEGFITSISVGSGQELLNRLPPNSPLHADSLNETGIVDRDFSGMGTEQSGNQTGEQDSRLAYNLKIRAADSAFNIARNLLAARQLYREASNIGPDRNYPKDQIVEIDKQLINNLKQPFFSKLTSRFYAIIVSGLSLVLLVMVYLIWLKYRHKGSETSKNEIQLKIGQAGPALNDKEGIWPVGLQNEKIQTLEDDRINEIIFLYPLISGEVIRETEVIPGSISYWKSKVRQLLNSPNEVVRTEALQAYIWLNPEDPFSFLDELELDFTDWEQLHIIGMIKRQSIKLPDFSKWLHSNNQSVVIFCQRMILLSMKVRSEEPEGHYDSRDSVSMGIKGIDQLFKDQVPFLQTVAQQLINNRLSRTER